MYCVYWQEVNGEAMYPRQAMKETLDDALKIMQTLRNRPDVRFVAYAIENPDNVGKMGVADVDENYDWQKRRDSLSARKKDMK